MQTHFRAKHDLMRAGLEALGVAFDAPTDGTFYAWGPVAGLPAPLDAGREFFRKALKEEKVIVVPGEFFDVNPGGCVPLRLVRTRPRRRCARPRRLFAALTRR